LIGDQQLHGHAAGCFGPFVVGGDLHALGGLAYARGSLHALALHLHHAGAAMAVGAIAGIGLPAKMRDLVAQAIGHLPDGFARLGAHLVAIELEGHGLAHRRSSGKCFITIFTGLQAAWPRPQMEASVMAAASSFSKASSQRGWLISFTAFSVPTRQGVHWPQLSSSKKRIRLSATAFMSSWSESTTTAAEPMRQPWGSSVPKSRGRSAMPAGKMPPEAPPGR